MSRALLGALLALLATGGSAQAGITRDIAGRVGPPAASRAHAANLSYGGGPVVHSSRSHLILWQPSGSGLSFEPGYEQAIETFLTRVAADSHLPGNPFGLTGQYGDGSGPAAYASGYAGAILDTDRLPADPGSTCTEPLPPPLGTGPGWTTCVNDSAIQQEISHVVTSRGLPAGLSDIYILVTPNGFGSCSQTGPDFCALGGPSSGYCGYHSVVPDTLILYAVVPYNAVAGHCQSDSPRPNSSTADPTLSTVAHEQIEVVTDPLGTAWVDRDGNEIADLCVGQYGPNLGGSSGSSAYDAVIHGGHYYLQSVWSNADGRCAASAGTDRVGLSIPATVLGDRNVTLSGSASSPEGASITGFEWSFADGRRASGRRVRHAFTRAGTVSVSLRATNSWDNWSFGTRVVRVLIPPPPRSRITGGPGRRTDSTRVRFRFASSAAIASFSCRVDRDAWVACRSPYTTGRLGPGGHTFLVRAKDTFGQRERRGASYAFTVA